MANADVKKGLNMMNDNQINKIVLRMPGWTRFKFLLYTHINKKKAYKIFKKYMHPIPKGGRSLI